jgi:hypothetical protein
VCDDTILTPSSTIYRWEPGCSCQGSSLGLPKPPSTSNQEATRASWRRSGLVPSRPTSGHRLLPPILDRRLVSGPLIRSVLGDLAQNYVICMPWWVHESLWAVSPHVRSPSGPFWSLGLFMLGRIIMLWIILASFMHFWLKFTCSHFKTSIYRICQ